VFKSKTLFIVGAGASQEAGLPTGTQLKTAIAERLGFEFSAGSLVSGDRDIYEAILQYARKGNVDSNTIVRDAATICNAMHQAISIDNFMDAHATNPGIVTCGKLGIAQAIIEAERNSRLSLDEHKHKLDHGKVVGTWYLPFFQILTENVRKEEVEILFDNVSFISFNYDRCIEHYLHHAIENYFTTPNATGLMQRLRVSHPYGVVGTLLWQDYRTYVSYGGVTRNADLLDIANQIRTFTERTQPDDPTLVAIRRQVQEAETIVFLGFAFHQLNMQLLTPETASNVRRVFGTAMGISDTDLTTVVVPEISEMLKKDVRSNTHISNKLSCSTLFGEYWHSLSRG
jgi:hypothetical protein